MLIYQTATVLIDRHGEKAVEEAKRLVIRALEQGEKDRALLMLRVHPAVTLLQAPPSTALH